MQLLFLKMVGSATSVAFRMRSAFLIESWFKEEFISMSARERNSFDSSHHTTDAPSLQLLPGLHRNEIRESRIEQLLDPPLDQLKVACY